jgi:lipoprotein-anchoring transpeptidase ErfK/SrfK
MARDYYSVLVRATSALDPSTEEARRAIYDRARLAIMDSGLPAAETTSERSALEDAIARIETQVTQARAPALPLRRSPGEWSPADPIAAPAQEEAGARAVRAVFSRPIILALGIAAVLILALVGTAYWPRVNDAGPVVPPKQADASVAPVEPIPSGDSRASSLSYVFKRQLVYYRTVHPVGTIVIAKSQRFLYLVRSNVVALRYTIGVGRECTNAAGLLLVSAKEEWPERPHPTTSPSQPPPSLASAGLSNSGFGARSLPLGDTGHRIYGTGALSTTAESGCFALANEDIIDLYNRVSVGTRVVIN